MVIKPGLDRVKRLLECFGEPQKSFKTVHVTGTNGKGSTCSYIAYALAHAGYRVGLFTSPYISKINEYMSLILPEEDGAVRTLQISDEELGRLFETAEVFAEDMEDKPSEFETAFAAACEFFKDHGCEIVVVEVGMGGRDDATNVIDPPLTAVFTNIGIDHVRYLGTTIEEITRNKAGIIKQGSDVVCYMMCSQAKDDTDEASTAGDTQGNRAIEILRGVAKDKGCGFRVAKESVREYEGMEDADILMPGLFQEKNAAVSLETVYLLASKGYNVNKKDLAWALANVALPARFEILSENPLVIADGGHNPQCIGALTESLSSRGLEGAVIFVTAFMADKDVEQSLGLIKPFAREMFCTAPDSERAMSPEELCRLAGGLGIKARACESVREGVREALSLLREETNKCAVCICGSFYMMDEARAAAKETLKKS
ncbi:MAG: bifunctional folylpolyglutamate synthase/dihydrofolate synthase [Lachnospiraceae bacterium]|nr:bifunctional folylpolyglutamate synthase/dihydrofolate synthase [Lachnospiraceae bacterium]